MVWHWCIILLATIIGGKGWSFFPIWKWKHIYMISVLLVVGTRGRPRAPIVTRWDSAALTQVCRWHTCTPHRTSSVSYIGLECAFKRRCFPNTCLHIRNTLSGFKWHSKLHLKTHCLAIYHFLTFFNFFLQLIRQWLWAFWQWGDLQYSTTIVKCSAFTFYDISAMSHCLQNRICTLV